MKQIFIFILLMGCVSYLRAQHSPSVTGNNAFNYKSGQMRMSGVVGEAFMNSSATLSRSSNSVNTGFPYRFVYTKDAFKGELLASKGYYSNYVRLQWELYNAEDVSQIKIFRRQLAQDNQDYRLVATASSQENSWQDQYAEPGVMYEYKVLADGVWDTEIKGINCIDGVGFRVTSATVTGRITYKGGNVVPGVKVVAEPEITNKNGEYSYSFPGSVYGLIRPETQPNLSEGASLQAWIKPAKKSGKEYYPVFSIGTSMTIGLNCTSDSNVIHVNFGNKIARSNAIPDSIFNEYMQLSMVWEGINKSCMLYLNGDSLFSAQFPNGDLANANWLIGGSIDGENYNYFSGCIDEVKLWAKAQSKDEVYSSFDAFENPNNETLAGYWKFNEGGGTDFYDISRKGNSFNENHGLMVSHSFKDGEKVYGTYEKEFPSAERLGCKAVTDDNGNYVIAGIPYSSGGSYFRIVPSLGVHRFDPTNKLLYISQESAVFNNVDFTDVSSFRFTGLVMYEGTKYPVKDVYIKVDGSIVADEKKQPVKTNSDGEFEIDVPIGEHYVSIEKNGHLFASSYWPELDENGNPQYFDFQDDVYEIGFSDTTKVKLVGKIVGGPIQASKPTGSKVDPTVNNLGVVNVTLKTERGLDLWANSPDVSFSTDPNTGVYEVELIPEKFILKNNLSVKNDLYTFNRDEDISTIDLTNKFVDQYTIDSVYNEEVVNNEMDRKFDHVDTALIYNHNRDWIWRSSPELTVISKNDSVYWGEASYKFKVNESSSVEVPLVNRNEDGSYSYTFSNPVFNQLSYYDLKVIANEKYTNADNHDQVDVVPVTDGVIVVENQLANTNKSEELELNENGKAVHHFCGGMPLVAEPFTKNINFKLKVDGNFISGAEITQPCYILGAKPSGGMNFVTGPNEVDFILRDPPGSDSYAYFEKGFTTSKTTTDSWSNGFGGDLDVLHMFGVKLTTEAGGLGFAIETEIEAENTIGLSTSNDFLWNNDRTSTMSKTYQFNYSTSDDPSYVGSAGDVFFGHGTNIFYGAATSVKILEDDTSESGYKIGTNKAIIVGKNATTDFVFSQNHIENYLIPDLIMVRNSLFEGEEYISQIPEDDPRYGLSNDDPVFENSRIDTTDYEINGPSYIYRPKDGIPTDSIKDDIYEYNKKLQGWKDQLKLNEQLKLSASDNFDEHNNYSNLSFDAGASVESSITIDSTYSSTNSYEWSIDAGVALEMGFTVNKFGMKVSATERYHHGGGDSHTDEDTETTTIGYVLADGDQGDYFSIDVKKDTLFDAPVFKLKGGQSACPYEGKELSRYFEPEKKHEISGGTMQIEVPEINTENSIVSNVPEGQPAVFTVNLSNTSEVGADNWFGLFVDPASNPDGAIVKVDGKALVGGMTILVPAGETVVKTVTVQKGRAEINDYEDLDIIMHSLCQFDPTDDVDNISDTVSVSAHFIASCTEVAIAEPLDQWTVNCDNENSESGNYEMPVKFFGYDLNHAKFQDFVFQYKPSEQSSWVTAQTFVNGVEGEDSTNIEGNPDVTFTWDMTSLQNRNYDIRAISHCSDGSIYESGILTGIFDNKRPKLFGAPQPADGILGANDEIMLSFDEDIQSGLLTKSHISLTGIQNNTDLRDFDFVQHNASLHFDGVAQNMTVAQSINLKYSPFTFEFWAKRERSGKECLINHGDAQNGGLWIGFDDRDRFVMKMNGQEIATEKVYTTAGIWNHYACVFDNNNISGENEIKLIVASGDDTEVVTRTVANSYFESGSMSVGYCRADNSAFKGNMHDLRIWNQSSTSSEVQARRYNILNGYEQGLIGAWAMDDVHGKLANDLAFSRHGQVDATWHVSSKGSAVDLNGGCAVFNSSQLALSSESDFTLEFWFKSGVPSGDEYILSNGKADGTDDSKLKWSIVATADQTIRILNDGSEFKVDGEDYLDNNWHHFAMSVNRRGNMNIYLDGESKFTRSSVGVSGMGGAKCVLGARYSLNITQESYDRNFNGFIDEFRIWNGVRTQDMIGKYMNHSLRGDEFGLKAYFPFEDVTITDPSKSTQTLNNMTTDSNGIAGACEFMRNGSFSDETPLIKLARPVSKIPFSYTTNGNRILITPNIDASRIENTTLDVSVEGVYDMNGNRMESTASWSAFVDKNQLIWEKQLLSLSCSPESNLEFKMTIMNQGGEKEFWQIDNLPVWLDAEMDEGTLDPLSSQEITFKVNPAVNVGQYSHDIYLNGAMEYNERCTINLSVKDQEPEWIVNPADYETSMTLIGQLKIAGDYSTDEDDVVAAFVNDQCRGVANVQHFADRDIYLVNLTVHGASSENAAVNIRVWDASKGNLYTNVSTSTFYKQKFNLMFEANGIKGYPSSPTLIETTDSIGREIPVMAGWNWLSFNLESNQLDSTNLMMEGVRSATNDEIKMNSDIYDEYVDSYGWDGGFSGKAFEVSKMYKLKNSYSDTIQLSGVPVLTSAFPVEIVEGWNWIGYTPQYKMPVSSAMAYHAPTQNDLLKSQTKFAMYDKTLGWIGSLMYMQPNAGYMYYSNNSDAASFVYPQETLFKKSALVEEEQSPVNASYEYNMSAMIEVENNPVGNIFQSKLLALADGKVVGQTLPVSAGDHLIYPLTVSGQGTEKDLTFHLVENGSETVHTADQQAVYIPNKIQGTVKDPFMLSFSTSVGSKVVVSPNPFKGKTTISNIPEGVTKVMIYDMQGRIIRQWNHLELGEVTWDGTSQSGTNVPTGVYMLKLSGVDVYQPKMIIMLRD